MFESDIHYWNQPLFTSGVRAFNISDPTDKARHDRMVQPVTSMLEIRFWPSGQRRIREERIGVLRCPRGSSEHRGEEDPRGGLRALNKKLQGASLDHDRTLLQRQIEATDASIDKLVYELYGLTEEEIAVVESGSGK